MVSSEVSSSVKRAIKEVAESQKIKLPVLQDHMEIVDDLGFTSLSVGLLIMELERMFSVDPFQDEDVMIDDMRTLKGICAVYTNCLDKKQPLENAS